MLLQVQLPRQGLRLNVKADPVLMVHNGTLTPADLPDQGIKARVLLGSCNQQS